MLQIVIQQDGHRYTLEFGARPDAVPTRSRSRSAHPGLVVVVLVKGMVNSASNCILIV